MRSRPKDGRTCVYRFYCHAGNLLYIGITNSPRHRFAQHALDKPWWKDVDPQATVLQWHSLRRDALRAEQRLIDQHRPPHNIQHNPHRRSRYAPEQPTSRGWVAKIGWAGAAALAGDFCGWWQMSAQLTAGATVATLGAVLFALGNSR